LRSLLLKVLAVLFLVAAIIVRFDPGFKLVKAQCLMIFVLIMDTTHGVMPPTLTPTPTKALYGVSEYSRVVYFTAALVGTLAAVGLMASIYQTYAWYILQEPISYIDWGSLCCGHCCVSCCDSYSRMSFWDT